MHWGYGILNGAQYGLVAESLPAPRIRYGLSFGTSVWASSYVIVLVLDNSAVGRVSCTPSFLRLLRCWLAHSRPRAGPTTDSSPAAKARLTHRTTGLPSG